MANSRRFTIESGFTDAEVRVVREELLNAGWKHTDGDDWGLRWESRVLTEDEATPLIRGDWINYLPGVTAYAMKHRLHDNVMGARHWSGDATPGIHATAYSMPDDRRAWLADRAKHPDKLWIKKPKGSAKGRGIELIETPDELPDDPDWMVQEYLHRPHLIDGHKYVLRRYLLITSLHPFVCYLHDAGVYKRTSRPYTTDPASRRDRFVHLTNPPVQKANTDVPWGQGNGDLTTYRKALRAQGIDDKALFHRVDEAITKMAIACREDAFLLAQRVEGDQRGCFDTLGIDVLVDEDLNPWVLECNVGPKMSVSDDYDPVAADMVRAAKDSSIRDALSLLGFTREPMPVGDSAAYWERRLAYEAKGARGFSRLWPREEDPSDGSDDSVHVSAPLRRWFPILRPADRHLLQAVTGRHEQVEPVFAPNPDVSAHPLRSGLILFAENQQRFYWLNDTGAFVWLCLADGLTPGEAAGAWVATEQEASRSLPFEEAHQEVWNLIVAWGQRGLLVGTSGPRARIGPDDLLGRPSLQRRGEVAVIDLRNAVAGVETEPRKADTISEAGAPSLGELITATRKVVFLTEGTRAQLRVCDTTELLDRLVESDVAHSALEGSQAAELVAWADRTQAFELAGTRGFDEAAQDLLLNLVSLNTTP